MPTPSTNKTTLPQEIATAAYGLWEQAGRPEGRDREFWFQAEQQLATKPANRAKKSGSRLATAPYAHDTHH